jgi:hypothetical protein
MHDPSRRWGSYVLAIRLGQADRPDLLAWRDAVKGQSDQKEQDRCRGESRVVNNGYYWVCHHDLEEVTVFIALLEDGLWFIAGLGMTWRSTRKM